MSKIKIELNKEGVKELLKSGEMMAICEEHAREIQQRCGDGYEISTHVGVNRVNASVYAESKAAIKDNLENNTLLRAMQ